MTKRFSVPPTARVTVNLKVRLAGLPAQRGWAVCSATGLGFVAEQTLFAPDFSTLDSTQGMAS